MSSINSTTRENLARSWNCSTKAIDRLIRAGDLKAFKIGRSVRIPIETILEFQEKNKAYAVRLEA